MGKTMLQNDLRTAFKSAHDIFQQVLDDIDDNALRAVPSGANIQSIQSILAHAVIAEDFIVNGMILKKGMVTNPGLLAGTGVNAPEMPRLTPEWAGSLDMKLPQFREYANAVFASTEEGVAGMSDEALSAEIEGPFGKHSATAYLVMFALYHLAGHTGEVAAIKGVHGLKGLPF